MALKLKPFYKISFEMDTRHLIECANELEDLFDTRLKTFRDRIDTEAASLSASDAQEFYDWHSDSYWKLGELFPDTTWQSLFLVSYAYLENQLSAICRHLQKAQGYQLALDDLKDKGIVRARTYITKVALSSWPSAYDGELAALNKLRNFLMHQGGVLDDKDNGKAVRAYIAQHSKLLSLDQSQRVHLTAHFCRHALTTIQKLLLDVLVALPDF